MSEVVAIVLAAAGTFLAALGGFTLGQWWFARTRASLDLKAERQIGEALEKVLSRLEIEDNMAAAVDPLAHGGRTALASILDRIRDHGGYSAVVLSDDAGLVLAACGPEDTAELMAVEAAAFGTTSERVRGRRQTILESQPDKRWVLHRYFEVEQGKLCLSATRQGGTPRTEALDGALGAFERVLSTRETTAA